MEYNGRPPIDVDIANGTLHMGTANMSAVEAIRRSSSTRERPINLGPKEVYGDDEVDDFGPQRNGDPNSQLEVEQPPTITAPFSKLRRGLAGRTPGGFAVDDQSASRLCVNLYSN